MGYVFNCDTCLDIRGCQTACKLYHHTPMGIYNTETYTSVDRTSYPNANEYFIPLICQHCTRPSCVSACTAGAIEKRPDGVVVIARGEECASCETGACEEACPYGGIHFDRPTGKAYKCDLCVDRLEKGLSPRCVEGCLSGSRFVGDFDDPNSVVSQTVANWTGYVYQLRPGTGNGPNVYYLLSKHRWDDMDNLVSTQWHNPK
jgi:Fe-S-cluster-containing dehydrogenase component